VRSLSAPAEPITVASGWLPPDADPSALSLGSSSLHQRSILVDRGSLLLRHWRPVIVAAHTLPFGFLRIIADADGGIECAATATDGHNALARLVRREGETLNALLRRLDKAIKAVWAGDDLGKVSSQERVAPFLKLQPGCVCDETL